MNEYLDFAIDIAYYAGDKIKSNFLGEKELDYKNDKTVVTEIDKDINHYLIERVKAKYPGHSVNGEEEKFDNSSNYVWVCDPVDGTGMFVAGIPVAVFSLAFVVDGEVQVGVVYDPYLDKMYTAIKGEGAYCNKKRIRVNRLNLGDLGYRLNYEMWQNAKYDTMDIAKNLLGAAKISSIGSVARSCMAIATGDFSCDLFPGVEHGNCDIAASALIVTEAGGMVTDFHGNFQRYDRNIDGAIISNGVSHHDILKEVLSRINDNI